MTNEEVRGTDRINVEEVRGANWIAVSESSLCPAIPITQDGGVHSEMSHSCEDFYIGEEQRSVACQTTDELEHVEVVLSWPELEEQCYHDELVTRKAKCVHLMHAMLDFAQVSDEDLDDVTCLGSLTDNERSLELQLRDREMEDWFAYHSYTTMIATTKAEGSLQTMD